MFKTQIKFPLAKIFFGSTDYLMADIIFLPVYPILFFMNYFLNFPTPLNQLLHNYHGDEK